MKGLEMDSSMLIRLLDRVRVYDCSRVGWGHIRVLSKVLTMNLSVSEVKMQNKDLCFGNEECLSVRLTFCWYEENDRFGSNERSSNII